MKYLKNIMVFLLVFLAISKVYEANAQAEIWNHNASYSTGSLSLSANKTSVNGYYPKGTVFTLKWSGVYTDPDCTIGSGGLAYDTGYLHVGFADRLAIPKIDGNTYEFIKDGSIDYATEQYHGHIIHEDTSGDIWQEYWAAKAFGVTMLNNSNITFARKGSSIGTTNYNTWDLTYKAPYFSDDISYIFIANRDATSGDNDYAFAYKSLGSISLPTDEVIDEDPPIPTPKANGANDINIKGITYYKESNLSLSFVITDDKSGVKSLSVKLPTQNNYTNYSGSSLAGSQATYKTASIDAKDIANGTFNYQYYATDNVDLSSTPETGSVEVDGSAPTINSLNMTANAVSQTTANNLMSVNSSENEVMALTASSGDWTNTSYNIKISATDNQIGLQKYVLQQYSNNSWKDVQTINLNGEVTATEKNFTVSEYGLYRVACYDKFDYVSYSSTFTAYIDEKSPVITGQDYGWTNQNINVSISATDDLSGLKTFSVNKKDTNGNSGSLGSGTISSNLLSGTFSYTEQTEGDWTYTAYAKDNAGNEASKNFSVKLDKTAPTGTVNYSYDGYNLSVDVNDIVEKLSGVKQAWVVITDYGNPGISQIYSLNKISSTHYSTVCDIDTLFSMSDQVEVKVYITDNANNQNVLDSSVFDVFNLSATISNLLGATNPDIVTLKRGEKGVISTRTAAYVDSLEITFPAQMLAKDPSLNTSITLDHQEEITNQYTFTVPLYVDENTYTIKITAYKNGKEKSVYKQVKVNDTILNDFRTVIINN